MTPDRVGFCSKDRIAEIQEILASPVRETVEGDVVHIRPKKKDPDGKWDYYWSLKRKVDAIEGLEWEGVISYCQHVYEVEEVDDLPMKQLSELDILITEKDTDFLQLCRKYSEATRKLKAAREACHKVYNECKKAFDDLMRLRESSYDDVYKKCFQSFGRAVSRNFGRNLLASAFYTGTVAKFKLETEELKILLNDIRMPAEYIQKFVDRYLKRREQQREELEKEIIEAHHLMLAGVQEKFQGIDLYKFALQVDSRTYWIELGQTPSVAMQRSDIDEKKTDKDLRYILKHYHDIIRNIDEDADWLSELVPEVPVAEVPVAEAKTVGQVLGDKGKVILRIGWMSSDPATIEGSSMRFVRFDEDSSFGERSISEIPEELLVQLLEIARKGESS